MEAERSTAMRGTTAADIAALTRQRDDLSRQIDAATRTRDEAYAEQLGQLQEAMEGFADRFDLPTAGGERKNVVKFTLDGWLDIEFGYPGNGYTGFLIIHTQGGISAAWHGELPPLAAFTGYLTGLVEHDRATTK
jgi:hypothetical protein